MSAHSPGPWTWRYFKETLIVNVVDGVGEEVITFMPYADKGWISEADARLVAAAPELLAALRDLVDSGLCVSHPECAAARALIARIEGEQ